VAQLRRTPILLATLVVAATVACDPGADTDGQPPAELDAEAMDLDVADVDVERLDGITTALAYADFVDEGAERWQDEVPAAEDIVVTSTADGEEQPVMWLPPSGDGAQPLLVVLHSWSTGHLQHQSIPYARWAEAQGWAAIFPEFRGTFDRPEATGSDLAVQDVLDAIDHAVDEADVDADRIFVTGFSGGGMMTLLMAGRHPDRFAGAAAWVPVHDLIDWYGYNIEHVDDSPYPEEIEASCGGDPTEDEEARASCEHRSPLTHVDGARDAGLPIYLGHGIDDDIVRPDASLEVFDALADPEDRHDDEHHAAVFEHEVPDEPADDHDVGTFFRDGDPEVLYARRSGPVTLLLFDGEHDMVYHPALEWMAALAAS
jgi:poly(3-hydroxybutyrate) depolymerase